MEGVKTVQKRFTKYFNLFSLSWDVKFFYLLQVIFVNLGSQRYTGTTGFKLGPLNLLANNYKENGLIERDFLI